MKNLLGLFMILAVGVAWAGTPVETLVPIKHIYSPRGFDSNDNTEILVTGFLPNLCHKSPFTKVKIKKNRIDITVKALKYDSSNPYCPEVIVPFMESVKVGLLDKGFYDIRVNGKSVFEKRGGIYVAESTSDAVDDYIYANVEYIEKVQGTQKVLLKGYNPSDCFVFDKVQFFSNNVDTYSILPKMKKVSDFCPMKMTPFTYEVEVPKDLKREQVLLHVRVMNGKSVNTLFYTEY